VGRVPAPATCSHTTTTRIDPLHGSAYRADPLHDSVQSPLHPDTERAKRGHILRIGTASRYSRAERCVGAMEWGRHPSRRSGILGSGSPLLAGKRHAGHRRASQTQSRPPVPAALSCTLATPPCEAHNRSEASRRTRTLRATCLRVHPLGSVTRDPHAYPRAGPCLHPSRPLSPPYAHRCGSHWKGAPLAPRASDLVVLAPRASDLVVLDDCW